MAAQCLFNATIIVSLTLRYTYKIHNIRYTKPSNLLMKKLPLPILPCWSTNSNNPFILSNYDPIWLISGPLPSGRAAILRAARTHSKSLVLSSARVTLGFVRTPYGFIDVLFSSTEKLRVAANLMYQTIDLS